MAGTTTTPRFIDLTTAKYVRRVLTANHLVVAAYRTTKEEVKR